MPEIAQAAGMALILSGGVLVASATIVGCWVAAYSLIVWACRQLLTRESRDVLDVCMWAVIDRKRLQSRRAAWGRAWTQNYYMRATRKKEADDE